MGNSSNEIGLVVTRTPLRISLAGGGTDMPYFYTKHNGAVLSTSIDKYLYVTVKRHGELFDEKFRLNYSATEQADQLDDIKNDIARECLRLLEIEPPIYISTVADLPGLSGLGSSSSFAVGLLKALHAFMGKQVSPIQLAEEAARVEIEILESPIGKQDHYAAAFGGLSYLQFQMDGRVTIEPQNLSKNQCDDLFANMLLFWTGIWRNASSVLTEQQQNTDNNSNNLLKLMTQAQELRTLINTEISAESIGNLLDQGWTVKKNLASGISNAQIDDWYERAKNAGAFGGKLCGAGGGGFLLMIADPGQHEAIRHAVPELTSIPVGYEAFGSKLMLAE